MSDELTFLLTASVLVFVGMASMSYSRNLIKTVMSFQVVVFGVNLALFSSGLGEGSRLLSDTLVLFSVLVGASVEAVGLAIIVTLYRKYGTLDPNNIRGLKN